MKKIKLRLDRITIARLDSLAHVRGGAWPSAKDGCSGSCDTCHQGCGPLYTTPCNGSMAGCAP